MKRYSFNKPNLNEMDIAIIRGGLGTISDCIAARIPMIYIHDANPEVRHNQECLERLNIGIPIASINDSKVSPLLNAGRHQFMLNHFSHFDLHGVKEASEIIKSRMRR
jgi:UDP-N-acetylglucosamine:LPS N-acetylglucosamine transferase